MRVALPGALLGCILCLNTPAGAAPAVTDGPSPIGERPPIPSQAPPPPSPPASETAPPRDTAGPIRLVSPPEDGEIIDRRPVIQVVFGTPVVPSTVLVVLDGVDVTQMAAVSPLGFSYRPLQPVPAGRHSLAVTARGEDGTDLQRTFGFATRHGETLLESSSSSELTASQETALARLRSPGVPSSQTTANFRSENRFATDHVQLSLNTTLRYAEQSAPFIPPLRRGIDLINYVLSLGYSRERFRAEASAGDLTINETTYTVSQYARRGLQGTVEYGSASLRAFNVRTDQVYGIRGQGQFLPRMTSSGHLRGVGGGVRMLNGSVEVRGALIDGSETSPSYNFGGIGVNREGRVAGGLIVTDFFANRLRTETEVAFSRFDGNTGDEFSRRSGNAYRIKAGGTLQPATYDLQYERVSTDFASIGNPTGLLKDRETWSARSGVGIGQHSLNAGLVRQMDNLKLDPLLPRSTTYLGSIDYGCMAFPEFPAGVSFQKSVMRSSHEPRMTDPGTGLPTGDPVRTGTDTDTLTARIGYNANPFAIMGNISLSRQNDTKGANDSETVSVSLAPTYTLPDMNLSVTLQMMENRNIASGLRTETLTATTDIRNRWLEGRLTLDLGATCTMTTNSADTVDSWNLTTNARLGYTLPEMAGGFFRPSVALRGTYAHTTDRIDGSNRDEATVFLLLATAVPFIF